MMFGLFWSFIVPAVVSIVEKDLSLPTEYHMTNHLYITVVYKLS